MQKPTVEQRWEAHRASGGGLTLAEFVARARRRRAASARDRRRVAALATVECQHCGEEIYGDEDACPACAGVAYGGGNAWKCSCCGRPCTDDDSVCPDCGNA